MWVKMYSPKPFPSSGLRGTQFPSKGTNISFDYPPLQLQDPARAPLALGTSNMASYKENFQCDLKIQVQAYPCFGGTLRIHPILTDTETTDSREPLFSAQNSWFFCRVLEVECKIQLRSWKTETARIFSGSRIVPSFLLSFPSLAFAFLF